MIILLGEILIYISIFSLLTIFNENIHLPIYLELLISILFGITGIILIKKNIVSYNKTCLKD